MSFRHCLELVTVVEQQPKPLSPIRPLSRFSWVPMEKARAQLSRNQAYVILILEGRLYSLHVERLFDLIAGHVESMRIFRLEKHE
jgi:hypothetical protein